MHKVQNLQGLLLILMISAAHTLCVFPPWFPFCWQQFIDNFQLATVPLTTGLSGISVRLWLPAQALATLVLLFLEMIFVHNHQPATYHCILSMWSAAHHYVLSMWSTPLPSSLPLFRPELAKPATMVYQHNLTAILESAVRATNTQYDHADVLNRLDVQVLHVSRPSSYSTLSRTLFFPPLP